MKPTDEEVEALARELCACDASSGLPWAEQHEWTQEMYREDSRVLYALIAPLVLERAAREAEETSCSYPPVRDGYCVCRDCDERPVHEIASAIRALKGTP